ncbi:MAG: FGGY-family carbohydrate kinase [Desulfobacterales bacterium]|nr:FGGY-family carbohydrate kinase [Desulfobacterales bacterium]
MRDSLCLEEKRAAEALGRSAYGLMDDLAAEIPLGCGGLIFYPHLRGINAYPFIRGCYFGITPDHGKAHFIRAVLEGVAFGIYDGVRNIEALDCRLENFRIIGGGARSARRRQILSDVTGRPLLKPRITDASFGTALLAGLGVGVFSGMEQAVKTAVHIEETITPDEDNYNRYQRLYEVYKTVEGICGIRFAGLQRRWKASEGRRRQAIISSR